MTNAVRKALLCTTALHAVAWLGLHPAVAQPAPNARPMGGQVVAGSASIAQAPNATNIAQSSNRAAIDWRSFDVGGNQSVNFAQPNATSVTLNRVTGPDPSQIAGRINANGQVVITNGSGVYFHQGAQVNAQSLVVSAAGISNANFMAGRMAFDGEPKPGARIENRGTITVAQAGLAALVAPSVANSGVINARLGQVVLAGARTHTLDMYGDGLVSIDVTGQVRETPRGPDGAPVTALVTNTGLIRADGGVVQLTASAADGVVSTLVRSGGRVQANTVGARTGRVEITGTGGAVVVEGRVAVDGRAPGAAGGEVLVAADGITGVAGGAHISANGRAGGGTVAIGTTLARARSTGAAVPGTSLRVIVGQGALVSADGLGTGSGGRVTVLSTDDTRIGGTLTARGGKQGGDGGTVEMSGIGGFALTGTADTSAPHGRVGEIVLDPYDLQIVANTGTNSVTLTNGVNPNLAFSTNGSSYPTDTVTVGAIEALTGSTHLQTVHDLTLLAPLTLTGQRSLFLEAGNNLTVAAGASITTDGFTSLTASSSAIPGHTTTGAVNLIGDIVAPNATLNISAGSGGIGFAGAISASNLGLTTTGTVAQTTGSITADQVQGSAINISLPSTSNAIGNVNGTAVGGPQGDFLLVDRVPVSIGFSTGGGISVQTGRTISITADGITLVPQMFVPTPPPVLSAPGGVVALAPFTAGTAVAIVGALPSPLPNPPQLLLTTAALKLIKTGTLELGAVPGGAATASTITLGDAGTNVDLTNVASALVLQATGAVTQGGALFVASVSGQSGSLALGDFSNSISKLAGFASTAGDIALKTTRPLTVSAPVVANGGAGNVTLTDTTSFGPPLTIASDIQGATVSISKVRAIGSVGGGINQTDGVITAGTLLLDGPSANLPDQNQVSNLGASAIDNALLLTTVRALGITGDVSAQVLTLNAASITQSPTTTINTQSLNGTAGSASFDSPTNLISQVQDFSTPGGRFSLTSSVLLDVNAITADNGQIALTANMIRRGANATTLSALNGSIQFQPLTVGFPLELIAGPGISESALSITQPLLDLVTTSTLILGGAGYAGPINIGNLNEAITLAGHATTLQLQTSGAVTEGAGATLTVPDVVGFSSSLALTGANAIGSIGLGNAAPGTLTGYAATGALALTTASGLTVNNTVSGGGPVTLVANGGDLTQASGTLSTPGTLTLTASGAITQAGQITAGLLTGSAASVSLTGPNQIVSLGPFTTTGDFTLTDDRSLAVVGQVDPGNVTLNVNGDLAIGAPIIGNTVLLNVTGAITELTGGEVLATTLTGDAQTAALTQPNFVSTLGVFSSRGGFALIDNEPLMVSGPVTDATSVFLQSGGVMTLAGNIRSPIVTLVAVRQPFFPGNGFTPSPGNIVQTAGTVSGSTSVSMTAAGTILQTDGVLLAGALSGSSGGTTSLTSVGNRIAALGPFTSNGGFALTDGRSLAVTGAVTDSALITLGITGDLSLGGVVTAPSLVTTVSGAITQPGGSLQVGTFTGAAASATINQAGNAIGAFGPFAATGSIAVTDGVPLAIAGAVTAGPGQSVTITGASPSFGPGGSLTALNGNVTLQSTGGISVGAGTGVGATPPVNANTLTVASLGGGPVAVVGDLNLPNVNTLDLETTGAITQTGAITVATLTGRGGSAILTGANRIGTLNGFDVGAGTLALNDAGALTISGFVRASLLQVSSVGSMTLVNAAIATDGTSVAAETASATNGSYLQVAKGAAGAQFTQLGTTPIAPLSVNTATLRIGVQDGTESFGNLVAPGTNLIVSLGRGTATGNMQVGSLLVVGTGGGTNLFGTVGGQVGFSAAQTSRILPNFDLAYLFNNCAIASVSCTPVPPILINPRATQLVETLISPSAFLMPKIPEIDAVDVSVARDRDDPSLLLPNISDRDY